MRKWNGSGHQPCRWGLAIGLDVVGALFARIVVVPRALVFLLVLLRVSKQTSGVGRGKDQRRGNKGL